MNGELWYQRTWPLFSFGFHKTLTITLCAFLCETIRSDVRDYVKNCIMCQQTKPDRHPVASLTYSVPTTVPRQILSVYLIGKLPTTTGGKNYVCTCMDVFARYLVTYPIRQPTTATVIKCLELYFVHLVMPIAVLSDNGKCFSSRKYTVFLERGVIQVLNVTP